MNKNIAILLIDMCDYFIDTPEKKRLIPRQQSLITHCSGKGIPLIVIDYPEYGLTTELLQPTIDSFSKKNIVFSLEKHCNNAFRYGLGDLANALKTELFILMGINAGYCVGDTARAAKRSGFKIATSKDLIAGWHTGASSPSCDESWYEKNGIYTKTHAALLKELALN